MKSHGWLNRTLLGIGLATQAGAWLGRGVRRPVR